ncbi:hypothetical protein Gpo141_00011629 [Globisporangium polare]
MHNVKRPLPLFLGAAGASMSSYLYMGDDATNAATASLQTSPAAPTTSVIVPVSPSSQVRNKRPHKQDTQQQQPKALSKKELGLDQSLARDVACWISSASVYAARQAFNASAQHQPSKLHTKPTTTSASPTSAGQLVLAPNNHSSASADTSIRTSTNSNVYHNLFGWLQELTPSAHWDPQQVIQSSSFTMLLNLVSGSGTNDTSGTITTTTTTTNNNSQLVLRADLEQELFRAVGVLATNAQCARAIAERATRYGKLALLNLAHAHEDDPRVGAALHKLVVLDEASGCSFGPANLVSLMSLAVASDIPDEYLEFALWAMSKAASPHSVAPKYEWRKTLFGDDATAKTRRKLLNNDALWTALLNIADQRSEGVQLQAARLLNELSDDPLIGEKMRCHEASTEVLMQWMVSSKVPLVCTALEIIAKVAQQDEQVRTMLLDMGMLDVLRMRILDAGGNRDCRMTAKLLRAVHCIAEPVTSGTTVFALDQDALSFLNEDDDEVDDHPLHHDDFVAPPRSVNRQKSQYVDGWIELFTAFLKSDDERVRDQAALCLHQIAEKGAHTNQSKQEWLIAILDAVLNQVPLEIACASTSVREAKSRTRPIAGYAAEGAKYEAAHAKALKALAFVLSRKECQQELVRLGGLDLLKLLIKSENPLVQRETARVLANLFSCDGMHEGVLQFALGDEELTQVLESWTQSSDIQLQSLAHRARSNRRYQSSNNSSKSLKTRGSKRANKRAVVKGDGVKYLDGVHPLHFSSTPDEFSVNNSSSTEASDSDQYDVDVVFLHGLLGCPYETWMCGEDESTVWGHKWLLEDLKREGRNPRVLSIGYDSQLLSSDSAWRTMGFQCTSEEITNKLQAARVGGGGESGRPVIFVTHSLGGVLLKQILHDSATSTNALDPASHLSSNDSTTRLVDNVAGVLFYGVPHHGSPVAQTIRAFRPKSLGIDQHPVTEHLHGTPHSEMLNDWCAELFAEKGIAALSIGETLPCRLPVIGFETLVVPPESANPGFGEFVTVENSTHMSVCKPSSQEDVRYTLAKEFITKHASLRVRASVDNTEDDEDDDAL